MNDHVLACIWSGTAMSVVLLKVAAYLVELWRAFVLRSHGLTEGTRRTPWSALSTLSTLITTLCSYTTEVELRSNSSATFMPKLSSTLTRTVDVFLLSCRKNEGLKSTEEARTSLSLPNIHGNLPIGPVSDPVVFVKTKGHAKFDDGLDWHLPRPKNNL